MRTVDSAQGTVNPQPIRQVMNLKNQLAAFLKERGMTAAELSRKSAVSKQVLSLWLGGASPKNVTQLKRVADALKISVDQLVFGTSTEAVDQTTDVSSLIGDKWIGGVFELRVRRVKGQSNESNE